MCVGNNRRGALRPQSETKQTDLAEEREAHIPRVQHSGTRSGMCEEAEEPAY